MVLSLGRTLYNLTGRSVPAPDAARPPRPAGPLVWLHSPDPAQAQTMVQLAHRVSQDLGANVLLTCPEPLSVAANIVQQRPPGDGAAEAKSFLAHWRPNLAILADGEVRPALLHEAEVQRLPLLMVEARSPYFLKDRGGWYPGLMRSSLNSFREIMALDEMSARALRKAGAEKVTVAGRMEEPSAALSYHEPERAALAEALATRSVWLAADVPAAEEAAVIAAHRTALRLAHRLLLVLVPQDPGRASDLAARLEAQEGWAVALRSLEQEPDPEIEVYIPDSSTEYGLWYRLAPVTFLGGSLLGDGCLRNPLEPAALGSAVIYGPRPGLHGVVLARLGTARAARAVGTAPDLADALSDLLAPDRAAKLAHAAWALASEGVDVTDRILDLARRILNGEA